MIRTTRTKEELIRELEIANRKIEELEFRNSENLDKRLIASEEKFKAIAENMPGIFYMYDQFNDGSRKSIYFSSGHKELLGKNLAIESQKDMNIFFNLIVPEDLVKLQKAARKAEMNGSVIDHEYRIRIDNNIKWVRTIGRIKHLDGGTNRWQGVLLDITERKSAQEALQESDQRYFSFIQHSSEGIFRFEFSEPIPTDLPPRKQAELMWQRAILAECNEAYMESYNITKGSGGIGKPLAEISITGPKLINMFEDFVINGYRTENGEVTSKLNGEITKHFLCNAHGEVEDGKLLRVWGIDRDITDRKKAEEEIQRIAKLESIGILAGGIAHNFKNILAGISLNIGLAKYKPSRSLEFLKKAENAIDHATALATRFQTFSTAGQPVKEVISIKKVLYEVNSIALSGSNVKCTINVPEHIFNIEADPKQLNEVFTNLFLNSVDAMPSGGVINIETMNLSPADDELYIKVVFKDQGHGIPENALKKVFDPFYSTKDKNRGLGLSSVYYIIKKHGGYISVDSQLGRGTTFEILLQATLKDIPNNCVVTEKITKGSMKRILFMDDNESIRENMLIVGELLGHDIICVDEGRAAITKYEESMNNSHPFDIVILDLTIQGGGMQGEETLEELNKINPKVKAIVFSGHSNKPIVANYQDYGFVGKLDKPVSIESLSKLLNETG